jgi:hypothetical protein
MLGGAVVGALCCWLTRQFDSLGHGVLIGALVGPFAGLLIGISERKARGEFARADIGTYICVLFGLLPVPLMILQGLGGVHGRFSGFLLLGAMFAGPMAGLVIGGILDRAFEEAQKKSWGRSLTCAVAGAAICIAIVSAIDAAAYGPDPEEVGVEVKAVIAEEYGKNSEGRRVAIKNVTLVRKGRKAYTGFADVTVVDHQERLLLAVLVEDGMLEVRWTVEPPRKRDR